MRNKKRASFRPEQVLVRRSQNSTPSLRHFADILLDQNALGIVIPSVHAGLCPGLRPWKSAQLILQARDLNCLWLTLTRKVTRWKISRAYFVLLCLSAISHSGSPQVCIDPAVTSTTSTYVPVSSEPGLEAYGNLFYLLLSRSSYLLNNLKRHTELLWKLAFFKCYLLSMMLSPLVPVTWGLRPASRKLRWDGNWKPTSLLSPSTGHESFPSSAMTARGRTLK